MRAELRKLIREVLIVEAAKTAQNATGSGLAMMRSTDKGGLTTYVLYSPSDVEQMLLSGDIESDQIAKAIHGYLVVRPHENECWNAGEVKYSAAQKGYGPLMYQSAMNDFAGGLFPDRGSVSPKAREVWKRFATRSDVEKRKFDDQRAPRTPEPDDDCRFVWGTTADDEDTMYLNQAYDAPGDASGRSDLMANHQRFVAAMLAKKMTKSVVETMIDNLGSEYFSMRYGEPF